jgi:glucose/arabinose dehydrogenase
MLRVLKHQSPLIVIYALVLTSLFSCDAQPAVAQNWPTILLSSPVSGFSEPVHITHAGDGSGRLFIVERAGLIRIIKNGVVLSTPFLDLTSHLACPGDSGGLHGMAFPPQYSSKGYFYVKYVDPFCTTTVSRFWITSNPDVADVNGEQIVLTVDQLGGNPGHAGGPLYFGPQDQYLYISTGDAGNGGAGDIDNAQNPGLLLGKVLRIDTETGNPATYTIPPSNPYVNTPGYQGEIWALGLRNPWRFSFDRQTADLYIADVGATDREEIDFQSAASPGGENYGWRIMEGSQCYNGAPCDTTGLTLPVSEYDHSQGDCSITGGMVYRGQNYPNMQGIYFYGDYCSGRIWGLRQQGNQWQSTLLLDTNFNVVSFGEDENGDLFVTDYVGGVIYKITDTSLTCSFSDDFEDGVQPAWLIRKPNFMETGGNYVGTPAGGSAESVATPVFAGCSTYSVAAAMQTAGGASNKISLLGWYVDKNNLVELLVKEENDKVILKQKINGRVVTKSKALVTITPNTSYLFRVNFDGNNFNVYVDGNPTAIITMSPSGPVPVGSVGFRVKRTIGTFGDITVQ